MCREKKILQTGNKITVQKKQFFFYFTKKIRRKEMRTEIKFIKKKRRKEIRFNNKKKKIEFN